MRLVAFALATAILGLWLVARDVRTEPRKATTAVARHADLTVLAQQVVRVEPVLPAADDVDDEELAAPDNELGGPDAPSVPDVLDLSAYPEYGEVVVITGFAPIIDTSTATCGGPAIVDVEYLEPIPLPPSDEPTD